MVILGWILFGFVVGLIARAVMPGRDPLGLTGTIVLGIVGAVLAGIFGQAVGFYGPGEGAGFVAAVLGSLIVLSLYYVLSGRRRIPRQPGHASSRDEREEREERGERDEQREDNGRRAA